MHTRLSAYGEASLEPSPASRLMSAFAKDFRDGIDINLGVGYVNEDTIPSAELLECFDYVLSHPDTYRQPLNYGGPEGSPNLIRSLCEFLVRNRLGGLTAESLSTKKFIIGACGATSILDGLAQILPQGIVVVTDPVYYIYADVLERRGFELLPIPEDSEGISIDHLQNQLKELGPATSKISFFYLVTVSNPTSTILSTQRRRELLRIVTELSKQEGRQIPLIFDLAYEWLIHDPTVEQPLSVLPEDELGIVYEVGTLSKVLAPALRIGYLLGSPGRLMDAMVQKTSDAGFSAPLFAQEIASRFLDKYGDGQLRNVRKAYRQKASVVREGIRQTIGTYLENVTGGSGGFYFYLTFKGIETHSDSAFFRYLSRQTGNPSIDGPRSNPKPRVVYIPGEYCVASNGQLRSIGRRQLRISYGFETTEQILRGLELMREACEWVLTQQKASLKEPASLGD